MLEGLPISQWREVEVPIEPAPTDNKQVDPDAWPELPMPRDSHLLPLHSQQLLRAARACRPLKPPAPLEEDREDVDEEEQPKEVRQGFTIKKFVKLPRHQEEPEPEFLAKRRKGLPSQYAVNGQAGHPTPLRETKIKKVDSEGNVSVYKALVPEGQTLEAEVRPTEIALVEAAPAAATPGTVVEGVGIVNAEGVIVVNDAAHQSTPRRRPAPPKKKSKGGPGRGRKRVAFAQGSGEQGTSASASDLLSVPGSNPESGSADPSEGGDTPMADAGDDEHGDEESDDEGEDGGQSPMTNQSSVPPKTPDVVAATPTTRPDHEMPREPPRPQTTTSVQEIPQQSSLPPISLNTTGTTSHIASLPSTTAPAPSVDLRVNTQKPEQSSRGPSSSPELPLSAMAHSRQNSLNHIPTLPPLDMSIPTSSTSEAAPGISTQHIPHSGITDPTSDLSQINPENPQQTMQNSAPPIPTQPVEEHHASDNEPDLLGSLEAHLERDSASRGP